MFTRERHRRGVQYFGPYANAKKVRETLDVLNGYSRIGPAKARSRAATGNPVPRLPHRALSRAVRRVRLEGGLPAHHRAGDGVSVRRDEADPARARTEDAGGGRRRVARGGGPKPEPALRRPAPGRAAGGGQARGRHRGRARPRGRGQPSRSAGLPLRDGKLIDRYGFHLENVEGQELGALLEAFVLEYYGSSPSVPPQIVVPQGGGTRRCWRSSCRSGAAPASRCARRRAARSAASPSSPTRNAHRARVGRRPVRAEAAAARRGAGGVARGAQPREPSDRASSASTSPTCRPRRRSAPWSSSRTRCRRSRTTASSACGGSTARTTSPRWRRW